MEPSFFSALKTQNTRRASGHDDGMEIFDGMLSRNRRTNEWRKKEGKRKFAHPEKKEGLFISNISFSHT